MPNFHTAFTSDADWTTGDVNPPLAEIDRGLTYLKNVIVHCDGDITWDAGTLTWSDDIHIHFNRTDGKAIHNSIAAGSEAVGDNEFLYVTLNETDDTVLTEAVAAITTGSASNFLAYNILVLGYRNADSDDFFGVYLRKQWTELPATTTESGVVELATGAETATGTDTTRAVTPDGLADLYQYDTIMVPASEFIPRATAGAAAVATTEYATNDINMRYAAFDGASEEFVDFDLVMPENWDRGEIKAKFYWAPGHADCDAADTVEWELAAGALSDDDAIDAALGTGQVISDTVLAGEEGDLHVSGATPAITVGGTPALGDLVHFSASRNVEGTDDMAEDAWLFAVVIQFKRNQVVTAW